MILIRILSTGGVVVCVSSAVRLGNGLLFDPSTLLVEKTSKEENKK